MPQHPDPPSLTLARAIRDLLVDSGAMMSDKTAALDIAKDIINAEYAEEVLGPSLRAERAERAAAAPAASMATEAVVDLSSVRARLEATAQALRETVRLYDCGILRVTAFDPTPPTPDE